MSVINHKVGNSKNVLAPSLRIKMPANRPKTLICKKMLNFFLGKEGAKTH